MAKISLKEYVLAIDGERQWYGTMEDFLRIHPGDRRVQAAIAALRNQTSVVARIPHGDGTFTTLELVDV